jgi:hypothetical protein
MDQKPANKSNQNALRLGLFAFAACLGIVGCFLALDAFFPKEKHVSAWTPFVELMIGGVFLVLVFYVGRKNRLTQKGKAEVGRDEKGVTHKHPLRWRVLLRRLLKEKGQPPRRARQAGQRGVGWPTALEQSLTAEE